MKKQLRNITAAALIATASTHAFAGGAVAGATEPTQILNNVQLVLQYAQQVQMVENQLRELATLPGQVWGQAQADLNQLTSIVNVGQQISYTMQNVEQSFKQQYPGYQPGQNFTAQFRQWSTNTLDNIRGALNAFGLQSSQFATERSALNAIQAMANSPMGQTQAIQAGAMIASQTVDQLQKLRQLMMAQAQAQNTYMAEQSQTRQAQIGSQQDHFQVYTPSAATFSSAGGSK
ncbi:P-type conjugative transfer protein TrbJ [Burkholderia vietnamiensis]|uniref:P-type conjugative transfer protein TrbJ n=1 Tax=Burkholderia vietnamiensis TaxID=60552 RepID=UPI001594C489|nr:P-type conjugative transfer protein TrbJ [Burkholderia vietnamiensis]MCA8270392.1 P-type conjugative transfer protein TrbJ [Burkholderia vietnamiensis]